MKKRSDFCRCHSCNRINPGKEMFCLTCGSAELEPVGNELPFHDLFSRSNILKRICRIDHKGAVIGKYIIEPSNDCSELLFLVALHHYDEHMMPKPGHVAMRFYNPLDRISSWNYFLEIHIN